MTEILARAGHWAGTWLYFVCLIVFVGAVLGVVTHVLFGLAFLKQPDYAYLAAFGLLNGMKFGGVWAGGAAIVLCFMRAHEAKAG